MPLPHRGYRFTTLGLVFLLRPAAHLCDLLLRNALAIEAIARQGRRCNRIKISVFLPAPQWLCARRTKVPVQDVHPSLQVQMSNCPRCGTHQCYNFMHLTWAGWKKRMTDVCKPSACMQIFDNYAFGHVAP